MMIKTFNSHKQKFHQKAISTLKGFVVFFCPCAFLVSCKRNRKGNCLFSTNRKNKFLWKQFEYILSKKRNISKMYFLFCKMYILSLLF